MKLRQRSLSNFLKISQLVSWDLKPGSSSCARSCLHFITWTTHALYWKQMLWVHLLRPFPYILPWSFKHTGKLKEYCRKSIYLPLTNKIFHLIYHVSYPVINTSIHLYFLMHFKVNCKYQYTVPKYLSMLIINWNSIFYQNFFWGNT